MSKLMWYPRLADLLGNASIGLAPVDRTRLTGYDARPRREVYTFDGQKRESFMWEYNGTMTSASPASQHKTHPKPGESERNHLLRQLAEILELPGSPSDYHFAIQSVEDEFWKRRLDAPGVLEALEGLCWLNIRLLESCPDALRMGEDLSYPRLFAFECLTKILEREGYLREALEVARRAQPFGQMEGMIELLTNRIAAMEAEQ